MVCVCVCVSRLLPLFRVTRRAHTLPARRRWGRNLESAGEDPFLSGEYAVNFVQGLEHATETPYPLQGSACCKHFVANELDGWNGTDRNHIDSFVPQQDLVDSYLPSFQACVEEGKASGIMCSYNAVNGVPSCANDWLLGTLLRESWGFDGYVVRLFCCHCVGARFFRCAAPLTPATARPAPPRPAPDERLRC